MRFLLTLLCTLFVSVHFAGAQTLDKAAIEQIVRETILNKPEIIEEALEKLQAKAMEQKRAAMSATVIANRDGLSGDKGFHAVVGNPKGDVTLVEFFDYNCGYCHQALEDLQNLIKIDPNLRVVLKDLPVIRRESAGVAKISVQLRNEPKYFEFHQKLFAQPSPITSDTALKVAKEMGFDVEKLKANAESKTVKDAIEQSYSLATKLDIQGTPSYVLGDEMIYSAVGFEKLKTGIANIRKCGKTTACETEAKK